MALSEQELKDLLLRVCRPKGEWIYDGTTISLDWYTCSECKEYVNLVQEEEYRFCPYCGADMRGEE